MGDVKPGDNLIVQGVEVQAWSRAPASLSAHFYNHWWVLRIGPQARREMWAIGQRRHHGRFSRDWEFIGRYTWQGQPII